jgi:hypothetical protein
MQLPQMGPLSDTFIGLLQRVHLMPLPGTALRRQNEQYSLSVKTLAPHFRQVLSMAYSFHSDSIAVGWVGEFPPLHEAYTPFSRQFS